MRLANGTEVLKGGYLASIRQTLRPIVINGRANPQLRTGYWGGGKRGEIYILLLGLYKRYDGKLLFIIAAPTDVTTLANTTVNADCKVGMQLDRLSHPQPARVPRIPRIGWRQSIGAHSPIVIRNQA